MQKVLVDLLHSGGTVIPILLRKHSPYINLQEFPALMDGHTVQNIDAFHQLNLLLFAIIFSFS